MCKILKISRSGFYAWRSRPSSTRESEDQRLALIIKANFRRSRETYGYRRLYHDLKNQGESCGKHRVARLMRINKIQPKMKKKFRITTNSKHKKPIHDNKLARNFCAAKINERWTSDITYLPTTEGWLYLAVVMDLYSRRIIGWSMSNRMQDELVINALNMALFKRKTSNSLLLHSDRGSQYASDNYQKILQAYGIDCSMSRKGNCWDNSAMESFFHTLKTECTSHYHFENRDEAKKTVFEYIEVFYNRQRRHSYLNYQSPIEYEMLT
jgi:putative transposase